MRQLELMVNMQRLLDGWWFKFVSFVHVQLKQIHCMKQIKFVKHMKQM